MGDEGAGENAAGRLSEAQARALQAQATSAFITACVLLGIWIALVVVAASRRGIHAGGVAVIALAAGVPLLGFAALFGWTWRRRVLDAAGPPAFVEGALQRTRSFNRGASVPVVVVGAERFVVSAERWAALEHTTGPQRAYFTPRCRQLLSVVPARTA